MRRISATVAGVLLLTALTACSGSDAADCGVASGNASSTVDATGALGSPPEVSFPTPLVSTSIEKSVVESGSSAPLREGQPVILEATILNADDGSVLQQTTYSEDGGSLLTVGDQQLPALGDALECATLGSRIAVVAPASYGDATGGSAAGESIVYVVDVLRAFQSRADGAGQTPMNGMPSVVTAPDGTPGITVPNEPAPTDYRKSVLKKGDGDEVTEDDIVVAKLTAVNWDTRAVAAAPASTWEAGSAAIFVLSRDAEALGAGLVDTIVGETVGSQVLSVVPPGLGGAGGQAGPSDDTLVYVVDILGTID